LKLSLLNITTADGLIRIDWLVKAISYGSYIIWWGIAFLFITLWLSEQGLPIHGYLALFFITLKLLIHRTSLRSTKPLQTLRIELIIAAFIQGVAIVFMAFRPLPSLAIVAPISGFVLIGGPIFLLYGLMACALGVLTAFWFLTSTLGIELTTLMSLSNDIFLPQQATLELSIAATAFIALTQITSTSLALGHGDILPKIQSRFISPHFIDNATGLKNLDYFNDVIDEKVTTSLSSWQDRKTTLKTQLHLYQIRLINSDSITQNGIEIKDKTLHEISHQLINCISSSDLLIRSGYDEFVILTTHKKDLAKAPIITYDTHNSCEDIFMADLINSISNLTSGTAKLNPIISAVQFPLYPSHPELFSWPMTITLSNQLIENAIEHKTNKISLLPCSEIFSPEQLKTVHEHSTLGELLKNNLVKIKPLS
jgi:GGDEF domain-containing protein